VWLLPVFDIEHWQIKNAAQFEQKQWLLVLQEATEKFLERGSDKYTI
jgi:hypothetical protein